MHTTDTTPTPATAVEPDPFAEGPAITTPTSPPVVLECQRLREAGLRRLFLHAHRLEFVWPDTGQRCE